MNPEFEYGPVSRGIYIALICSAPFVLVLASDYLLYYVVFLAFLGFGLRFFLVKTGLFNLWNSVECSITERWNRKYTAKRAAEIDTAVEVEKYKRSRYRDPRLPKNW